MKVHLLYGNRICCDSDLPKNALFTINSALVSCMRCKKTLIFKRVVLGLKKEKREPVIQLKLFKEEG